MTPFCFELFFLHQQIESLQSLWPAAVCFSSDGDAVDSKQRASDVAVCPDASWESCRTDPQCRQEASRSLNVFSVSLNYWAETESHNMHELKRRLLQLDQSELQVILVSEFLNYCRKMEIKILYLLISACWWSGFLYWSTFFPDINLLSLILVLFCFLQIWSFRSGHL